MKTTNFCCETMTYSIKECKSVFYSEIFDEYVIPCYEDDGLSGLVMEYCPWCGKKLPESKSDEWFDRLEKLGYDDPLFDDSIPEEYKSSEWRDKL